MSRRRQNWEIGDVFTVPTADGQLALGQIVAREPSVLNSVTVALFDQRYVPSPSIVPMDLSAARAFSVLFTTRDLLDSGVWRVVGTKPVAIQREQLPYESTRAAGFIGAKVIGSAIVREFINAFFGLVPWDDWKDPNYLDGLLRPARKRPAGVMLKRRG
jgi:hypothetical protein